MRINYPYFRYYKAVKQERVNNIPLSVDASELITITEGCPTFEPAIYSKFLESGFSSLVLMCRADQSVMVFMVLTFKS